MSGHGGRGTHPVKGPRGQRPHCRFGPVRVADVGRGLVQQLRAAADRVGPGPKAGVQPGQVDAYRVSALCTTQPVISYKWRAAFREPSGAVGI
jgi:hypothetical protein